ncbi:hypothetical protein [Legionella gresilensis]|uniref:hypothetical protein n=1 Tax=Legionella gresilensis TaxID=91823 RepID=UPI0010414838|nr:hypothetical protein [Legionella gresilensis]
MLKINAKEAVAHLKDFATYLQQYGQGNLINSATSKIQGISLTTPKRSTQAEITFENPGIAQAYTNFAQALQQKIMDANKSMKTNLQDIVGIEQKELNAGEFTYPKF